MQRKERCKKTRKRKRESIRATTAEHSQASGSKPPAWPEESSRRLAVLAGLVQRCWSWRRRRSHLRKGSVTEKRTSVSGFVRLFACEWRWNPERIKVRVTVNREWSAVFDGLCFWVNVMMAIWSEFSLCVQLKRRLVLRDSTECLLTSSFGNFSGNLGDLDRLILWNENPRVNEFSPNWVF